MRAFFRLQFDRPLSPAERAYLPAVKSGAPRPVVVFGKWYPSISEAARATKNSKQTISGWLRKKNTRAQFA